MPHYWWVPIVYAAATVQSALSVKARAEGGVWVAVLWLSLLLSPWALIAWRSQRLVFDGMVVDVLILAGTLITFYLLGQTDGFSMRQYVGAVVVVVGLLLLHG